MSVARKPSRDWISIPMAAQQYAGHISCSTLRRYAIAKVIRSRRVGRCWDLLRTDLHRCLNEPGVFADRYRKYRSTHGA